MNFMQYHLAKMQFSWIEMDIDNLLISTKYDTHVDTQGSFETNVSQNKSLLVGRAIAQAVSHWLPTVAAQVRAWVWSCGICGGQSGAGAGFLGVLRFPLPIFIPPIAPQSPSSIIWG
jgi:hypothetical protein